jgi:hypothetical protein
LVYAVTAAGGSPVWTYNTGGPVLSSPAVDKDGFVYIGGGGDAVYCFRPPTSLARQAAPLRWRLSTAGAGLPAGSAWSMPALGPGGTLYVSVGNAGAGASATYRGAVLAVTARGGGPVRPSPLAGPQDAAAATTEAGSSGNDAGGRAAPLPPGAVPPGGDANANTTADWQAGQGWYPPPPPPPPPACGGGGSCCGGGGWPMGGAYQPPWLAAPYSSFAPWPTMMWGSGGGGYGMPPGAGPYYPPPPMPPYSQWQGQWQGQRQWQWQPNQAAWQGPAQPAGAAGSASTPPGSSGGDGTNSVSGVAGSDTNVGSGSDSDSGSSVVSWITSRAKLARTSSPPGWRSRR